MGISKKPILTIPEKLPYSRYVIMGLDPSLTSTGYSLLEVNESPEGSTAWWRAAGSLRPKLSSYPTWVRSKMIALRLRSMLEAYQLDNLETALILSFEFPTPGEDRLASLQRIITTVLFENDTTARFASVRLLYINASTLRSLFCLTKRGNNKDENIARAWEYINIDNYPKLDPDSCDAVLLAMVARYVTSIMLGQPEQVPDRFLTRLCDATQHIKGKGKNSRVVTEGVLHRPEYWLEYKPAEYILNQRDASLDTTQLQKISMVL